MVRDFLAAHGWVVLRCARSKPFDLVALKRGRILLVECKLNGSPRAKQRLKQAEMAARAGAIYIIVEKTGNWREKLRERLRLIETGRL